MDPAYAVPVLLAGVVSMTAVAVFFATARLTKLTPHEFFGIAFWIGFSLTYLVGECWIRYTRVSRSLVIAARARTLREMAGNRSSCWGNTEEIAFAQKSVRARVHNACSIL